MDKKVLLLRAFRCENLHMRGVFDYYASRQKPSQHGLALIPVAQTAFTTTHDSGQFTLIAKITIKYKIPLFRLFRVL